MIFHEKEIKWYPHVWVSLHTFGNEPESVYCFATLAVFKWCWTFGYAARLIWPKGQHKSVTIKPYEGIP